MSKLTKAGQLVRGVSPRNTMFKGVKQTWPTLPAFKPSDLSGLKVWLDAADYTSGSWPNKAAGGAAATFVGSPAPALRMNTLNGNAVVRFTVSEGRLRMSGNGVARDYTVAYVGRMWPGTYTAGRVVTATYPPANYLMGYWNGFQDVFYDNSFAVPDTRTSVVVGQWKLYSADCTTGGSDRYFSNGVLLGTSPSDHGWNGTLNISGYDAASGAESCDCEIAELVMYNRKCTDTERQQVETYLRTKWGLSS